MHASKFFKGTIIGIAVLAGSINLARAQADYTNTAWTGFFWTNATQWADGYSDGYYPGAQAAGGVYEAAVITNGGQVVRVDANNPLISDLIIDGTAASMASAVTLTNINQTLTMTNSLVVGDIAGGATGGNLALNGSGGSVFAVTNAMGTATVVIGSDGSLIVGNASAASTATLIADQIIATNSTSTFLFGAGTQRGTVEILNGSDIIGQAGKGAVIGAVTTQGAAPLLWYAGGTNLLTGTGSMTVNGSLLVSGPGTVVNASISKLVSVQNNTAFTVSGGANFTLSSPTNMLWGSISSGVVYTNEIITVTGPGSTLNLTNLPYTVAYSTGGGYYAGGLRIGSSSYNDAIIVSNGAYLLSSEIALGDWGGLTTGASSNNNMYVVAGGVVTNYGVIRVGNASAQTSGKNGLNSSLMINSGGQVYSGQGTIGDQSLYQASVSGTTIVGTNYGNSAVVSGAGSVWNVSSNISVGIMNASNAGLNSNNVLTVQNGATVTAGALYVSTTSSHLASSVASEVFSNNRVVVNGGNLFVTNAAGNANTIIGEVGQGSLVISNGGFMQANNLVVTNYGVNVNTLTLSNLGQLNAGTMTLNGVMTIDNTGDFVNVVGQLNLTGATLNFSNLGTLTESVYVFGQYGTLAAAPATVNNVPAGYTFDSTYNGDQLALIPEPSVLALVGTGLLGVAVLLRRRRK